MKFENWGPTGKNTRSLEDMVTPYVPMMDENANAVASNDTNLKEPDPFYELAYREYGQDELAWVLSKTDRDSWVALMYGVPVLPDVEDPRRHSAYKPNVGITALRSQGESQAPEEQVQAYLKYGTHGGWHGQFDRTGLLALDRYGHKYFSTEMVWFGYGHPGYKECVQTSATHNMVVVDGLQQEAVPSEQLVFYAGDMMQVSVVETEARWRKIPTFNIEKFPPWDDAEYEDGFEPVLQRRMAIVTDDYVVLADYMSSSQNHQYDWLIHPVGFQDIGDVKRKGTQLDQLSTADDSPYKYFKNAQWYHISQGTLVEFKEGEMHLDVHTLWPKKAEALIADYPNGGRQRDMRNNPNRRTFGVRTNGEKASFLTVLEPYKGASAIEKIESTSPDKLIITLKDGRTQTVTISQMDGKRPVAQIAETKNGDEVRREQTN
ncbi:hypothetical protein DN752_23100 [Echinicola strongylocentroti]|uniref:Uncharacterized protein n=2 Tax=Echinicola strongylocentroti TaxID=1795355 RepID=A0A2Z4IPQ2_9BACT|nr:hypothetical protein DN752_23100 [Echinicola strongylocentroti]